MARLAFTRPPVVTLLVSPGLVSTVFFIHEMILAAERSGTMETISAATPATLGVAMEVPLRNR